MKILFAILMSIFAFNASRLQAQECESNAINFRLDPFSLVADSVSAGIDLELTKQISLGIDAGYTHNTELTTGTKGKAYNGGLRLTYYADSMRDDSFITSVGINKSQVSLKDGDIKEQTQAITGDIKAGYRWIWDRGFNVQMAGGFGQTRFTDSEHIKSRHLVPVAEFSFGYQI
ncbi:MAG: DUF3575 domain-containing protein [Oligoflexales bacterium]